MSGCPVENVSWNDCQRFIELINLELPSLNLRLPSEAEWEYACRAGSPDSRYGEPANVAWYAQNSKRQTHEVKQKLPNAWGLHDMLGNVWEWCQDAAKRKYRETSEKDPTFYDEDTGDRVIRGGTWLHSGAGCAGSLPNSLHLSQQLGDLGFRCLSSAEPRPSGRRGADSRGRVS